MDKIEPIGAYRAHGGGWAAYDKHGRTRPINADQAEKLEAERKERGGRDGVAHD